MTNETRARGEQWVPIDRVPDESERGVMRVAKCAGHALVVGRDEDGCVFALDNRCPHEGYPLATGTLQGHSLTCCWHNWKFDVRDGTCTLGGEHVRSFAVRERDGVVEVDVSEPDPEVVIEGCIESLRSALFHHDNGRALRDAVRALQAGLDPHTLLAEVAAYDAEHAEYGTTHALAVAADCGRILARASTTKYAGVHAVEAIAPAIDMCGDANRRLARRVSPAAVEGATLERFRAAVEAEDAALAEGLIRGAFDEGASREVVERWLFAVLSDHFLDFGHPLIYLIKAQELLERVDDSFAARIYPALVYGIVLGTREDTLPYMEGYSRRLTEIAHELPDVHATRDEARAAAFDRSALRDAVLDGASIASAFDAVWNPLRGGVAPQAVAAALVEAAAHRLWRFDTEVDRDPSVAEGWLWATHRFTFASAVRNAVERFDSPDALRLIFHAAAFLHTGRRMDRAEFELGAAASPASVDDVLAAVRARDAEAAVARARGFLATGGSVAHLREAVEALCLDDPAVRPIVVAHAIKTACCAFEEYEALGDGLDRERPLLATLRFLASPVVERSVHEAALRSIRWVADGVMPAKLTQ